MGFNFELGTTYVFTHDVFGLFLVHHIYDIYLLYLNYSKLIPSKSVPTKHYIVVKTMVSNMLLC